MRYRFELYRPSPFVPYRYRMQVGSPPWRWRLQYDTFLRYPAHTLQPLTSERVLVPRQGVLPTAVAGRPWAVPGSVDLKPLAMPDRWPQEARVAEGSTGGVVFGRSGQTGAPALAASRLGRSAWLRRVVPLAVLRSLRQTGSFLQALVRAAVPLRRAWSLAPPVSALRAAAAASFLGTWRAWRRKERPILLVFGVPGVRRLLRNAGLLTVIQSVRRRWQRAHKLWLTPGLRRIARNAATRFAVPANRVVSRPGRAQALVRAHRQLLRSAGLAAAYALCRAAMRQAALWYAAPGLRDAQSEAWVPAELPAAGRAFREAASADGLPAAARGPRTAGFAVWLRLAERCRRQGVWAAHHALAARGFRAWAKVARTLLALRRGRDGRLLQADLGVYARDRVPAVVCAAELAIGRDLWHDIWTRFGPGLDRLPVPTRDFPYHTWWDWVLDEDGEVRPQALIGPLDGGDVEVRWPIQPLFDDVADWGTEPTDVPIETLVTVMLWWRRLWLEAADEIAHLDGASALAHLLRRLRNAIAERTPADEPWQYAFRMVRWYAERAVMERGTFRLRRTFDEQGRLVSARTEPILWAKSGPDAAEYVLRLLMKYFVDHHLDKRKGLRRRWLSLRRV